MSTLYKMGANDEQSRRVLAHKFKLDKGLNKAIDLAAAAGNNTVLVGVLEGLKADLDGVGAYLQLNIHPNVYRQNLASLRTSMSASRPKTQTMVKGNGKRKMDQLLDEVEGNDQVMGGRPPIQNPAGEEEEEEEEDDDDDEQLEEADLIAAKAYECSTEKKMFECYNIANKEVELTDQLCCIIERGSTINETGEPVGYGPPPYIVRRAWDERKRTLGGNTCENTLAWTCWEQHVASGVEADHFKVVKLSSAEREHERLRKENADREQQERVARNARYIGLFDRLQQRM